jgi:hypothetical protein
MNKLEFAKNQLDTLPDNAVEKVLEFIFFNASIWACLRMTMIIWLPSRE